MASLTEWTWVWVGSRGWWWAGKPNMVQSMGWQRVRHDWVTELNCVWSGRYLVYNFIKHKPCQTSVRWLVERWKQLDAFLSSSNTWESTQKEDWIADMGWLAFLCPWSIGSSLVDQMNEVAQTAIQCKLHSLASLPKRCIRSFIDYKLNYTHTDMHTQNLIIINLLERLR